jgi:DNA-binding LytR/AlgR family response regulator
MKVIIIEDEPLAQQELIRLLARNRRKPDVVAVLDSVEESIKWLKNNEQFDLIFMDIQLSDGMSFEILDSLVINKPVIFTTAYDQYLMDAFRLNSIDYLLKPVHEDDLENALFKLDRMKAHFLSEKYDSLQDLLEKNYDRKYKSRFVVRIGERYVRIPKEDVAYFFADGNLVFLVTRDNKKFPVEYTLDQLIRQVDPDEFFRLNRTFMSHVDSIREVRKYFNSRLSVKLQPEAGGNVIVSRARARLLIDWLDQ